MKTLVWSQQDVQHYFSECQSVGELISNLESRLLKDGELVCEVEINGMKLDLQDEERFRNSSISEIQTLRVKSNLLEDLLEDSFTSALGNIQSLRNSSFVVAEGLREVNTDGAFIEFEKMTYAIPELIELVAEIRSVTLPKVKKSVPEAQFLEYCSQWERTQKRFLDQINEVLESFEKKNLNLMADLIEYELTSIFDEWTEKLQWVREISRRATRENFSYDGKNFVA